MGRIICLDFGIKRTGIAVTDPLKIIATPLTTVETKNLESFLKKYFLENEVEELVIGEPLGLNDAATHATLPVKHFIESFKKWFPNIPVKTVDERFTSKMASRAMIDMGMKKKQRQNKSNIDVTAATLILQEYLTRI